MIPPVTSLCDDEYSHLSYPELLKVCADLEISNNSEQLLQIKCDTRKQVKGINFFKHRAGRIVAFVSKEAAFTDPAMPSRTLVMEVCYPQPSKLHLKLLLMILSMKLMLLMLLMI